MALKGNQQTTVSHFWCSPKKNIPISSLQIGFQAAAVRCQLCAPGGICGAKLLVLPAKLVVLLPQAVQLLRPFLLFACASSLVAKGSVQRGYAQLPKLVGPVANSHRATTGSGFLGFGPQTKQDTLKENNPVAQIQECLPSTFNIGHPFIEFLRQKWSVAGRNMLKPTLTHGAHRALTHVPLGSLFLLTGATCDWCNHGLKYSTLGLDQPRMNKDKLRGASALSVRKAPQRMWVGAKIRRTESLQKVTCLATRLCLSNRMNPRSHTCAKHTLSLGTQPTQVPKNVRST